MNLSVAINNGKKQGLSFEYKPLVHAFRFVIILGISSGYMAPVYAQDQNLIPKDNVESKVNTIPLEVSTTKLKNPEPVANNTIQINLDQNSVIKSINLNNSSSANVNETIVFDSEKKVKAIEVKDNKDSTVIIDNGSSNTNQVSISNESNVNKNTNNVTNSNNSNNTPTTNNTLNQNLNTVIQDSKANVNIQQNQNQVVPVAPTVVQPVVIQETQVKPIIIPNTDNTLLPTHPIVVHPGDVTEVIDNTKPIVVDKIIEKKSSRFSVRGQFGFGTFTTIDDIYTNYSLGFAVGYDLTKDLNLEFQYSWSEYEDFYNYDYYTQSLISGYVFDQQDFGFLLNYKFVQHISYNVYARGGINFTSRSAYNYFTGYTNSSSGISALIGIGTDIRIDKNFFIVGIIDYNLSLSDSGYNNVSSPLFLAGGEDFVQFNLGLKFKF